MRYKADFHIHSCLSPCAALEMGPFDIVCRAKEVGLNAIALTDHNCTFNLPAFGKICAAENMACLYGLEVTSMEEVHLLCLFDDLEKAMEFGERIYESLPPVPNHPDQFGDQPIVNEHNEIIGFAEKFLINATSFDVHSLLELTHSFGGLFIPAHIDRQAYGIIAQLGFLPVDDYNAVELTRWGRKELAGAYPVIRNSDSHNLSTIGTAYSEFEIGTLSVAELHSSFWN